jgi:hypothetical protein
MAEGPPCNSVNVANGARRQSGFPHELGVQFCKHYRPYPLNADTAEMGPDVQAQQFAITLVCFGADVERGPVSLPSIKEFSERGLRRVNALTCCLFGNEARQLLFGFASTPFETNVPNTPAVREWVGINVIF